MSSPPNPPSRPPYANYQLQIYAQSLLSGDNYRVPTTTDPNKLEAQAREAMDPQGFGYVHGGAGEQATMHANRLAFRQWKLVPRMLRRTAPRELRVGLFGRTYDSPVLMAPVGVQKAYHPDGEAGVAAACAALGVPFVYSTAASTSIEEVAAAADKAYVDSDDYPGEGARAPRWFQLYRPRDDAITKSLLDRAKKAGCGVLVVTLDTFTLSWRPEDLDTGYLPFLKGTGCQLGFSDPVFRSRYKAESGGEEVEDNVLGASRAWIGEVFSGDGHRWEDLKELREMWGDGPILLKGICCVEDAVRARECGMDGIVVSNHGGRQLDGAVPSLEVLPEIVDAVGKDMAVLFDSGIRTGADVMKALALGARAVLVGRPVIYGLGIAGEEGARHVLAGLLADLDQSMGLAGVKSVKELNRGMLRRVNYGGDIKSSL
ncbi:FMN-dependent alpha-hydroxy acid dehydrogenase [Coniochaeta ligniaria NRRL 30616]|uniref:FMN-dependent alpha-hydroxy acid dehydrogenase n=1 Tax=Coniochaeta ligniaria NRRL 30616 TaxID=1408157 RepID=A0A1J7K2K2_9PEZI|nr:FMN-dependent alpha-hydroxy acid dehydrogenase [Coniochaeta ligniaria NRRL 30616]